MNPQGSGIWILLGVIGIASFALRLSFIQWFSARSIPQWLQRALRFVPAAVLAALVVPAIVYTGASPGFTLENPRLLAGAIAAVVAWRTRNVLWTMAAGMGALWIFEALL
jgi:branched-subunit amino acid transport protein